MKNNTSITDISKSLSLKINQIYPPNWQKFIIDFVESEIISEKLPEEITLAKDRIFLLSEEINLFCKTSSRKSYFLVPNFSNQEKFKWTQIERLFNDLYNPENGIFRKIQNHILSETTYERLFEFITRKGISLTLEEKLVLKSVLLQNYLNSLRELISFFYITELEGENNLNDTLKLQEKTIEEKRNFLGKKISLWEKDVCNKELNNSNKMMYFVEIVHYFKPFVNYNYKEKRKEVYKKLPELFSRGKYYNKLCKLNHDFIMRVKINNIICGRNEKEMKLVYLFNNLKLNLITFELEVIKYHVEEVLNFSQIKTSEKQLTEISEQGLKKNEVSYFGVVITIGTLLTLTLLFFNWKVIKSIFSKFLQKKVIIEKKSLKNEKLS